MSGQVVATAGGPVANARVTLFTKLARKAQVLQPSDMRASLASAASAHLTYTGACGVIRSRSWLFLLSLCYPSKQVVPQAVKSAADLRSIAQVRSAASSPAGGQHASLAGLAGCPLQHQQGASRFTTSGIPSSSAAARARS